LVDSQFRLQQVNPLARPTFKNIEPLIGRDFGEVMEILWGPLATDLCAIFRHTLTTGERYASPRFTELRADLGEEAAYEWETQRVTLPDGQFGVVCYFNEVTEYTRGERALRESEERFRQTFENAAVGIAHVAPDGKWLRVNERICQLTGYPRELLLTKTFQDITHPADLEADLAQVQRLLAGETESYTLEKRYLRRDQSVMWGNLTVSCARSREGTVAYFIAVVEDISERKAQQLALERSEARLRRVFASNVVGMIRWDLDQSLILEANEAFYQMTGYTSEDIAEGRVNFRALTPPEWAARNEEGIRTIREHGFAAPYEKEYFRKDGSRVALIIAGTRFEDSRTEGLSFLIDISEAKRVEAALRESNERFHRLADAMPQLAWIARADGHIFWYNQRWYDYTGKSPREMEGWGWQSVHDPVELPRVLERFHSSLASGEPFEMTFPLQGADGIFRSFLTRMRPLKDAAGKVIQWFGTNTDISEIVRAEEEIKDLNTRLKRSVAESHHRIKNNLQVLSAMVELQSSETEESIPKEKWKRLSTHIHALASLHDILTLESKIGEGLTGDGQAMISLKTALERLLPLIMAAMGGRQIVYDIEPELRLPMKQGSSFVLLVNELVSNANKHGAGEIEVSLRWQDSQQRVVQLAVCDSGPGFAPGFDPQQAANTGLELIESLAVWDLRGTVAYQNRPEGGARVVITFPFPDSLPDSPRALL
jgi:PAS domain S-box-containing protein